MMLRKKLYIIAGIIIFVLIILLLPLDYSDTPISAYHKREQGNVLCVIKVYNEPVLFSYDNYNNFCTVQFDVKTFLGHTGFRYKIEERTSIDVTMQQSNSIHSSKNYKKIIGEYGLIPIDDYKNVSDDHKNAEIKELKINGKKYVLWFTEL